MDVLFDSNGNINLIKGFHLNPDPSQPNRYLLPTKVEINSNQISTINMSPYLKRELIELKSVNYSILNFTDKPGGYTENSSGQIFLNSSTYENTSGNQSVAFADVLGHEGVHSLESSSNQFRQMGTFPILSGSFSGIDKLLNFTRWASFTARSEADATIVQAEIDKEILGVSALGAGIMAVSTKWAYNNIINQTNMSLVDPANVGLDPNLSQTRTLQTGIFLNDYGQSVGTQYSIKSSYIDYLGELIGKNVTGSNNGQSYVTYWANTGASYLSNYSIVNSSGPDHIEFSGLGDTKVSLDVYTELSSSSLGALLADLATSIKTKDSNGNISDHIFKKDSKSATSKLFSVGGSDGGNVYVGEELVGTVSENTDYIVDVQDVDNTNPQATYSVGGFGSTGDFFLGTSYKAGDNNITEYQIADSSGQLKNGEFILEKDGKAQWGVHLKDINKETLNQDGSV